MTDYISREDAIEAIYAKCSGEHWEDILRSIPPADVRPVVRCGECKHCVEHYDTDGNAPYWVCKEWDSGTDYDGYCYHGEKKGR